MEARAAMLATENEERERKLEESERKLQETSQVCLEQKFKDRVAINIWLL